MFNHQPTKYRGCGRPRLTDVMPPKPPGKRMLRQMMRLEDIRRKFALNPEHVYVHGTKAAEGVMLPPRDVMLREIMSPRQRREAQSVRATLDIPIPVLPRQRQRKDNDISPQWVRELRKAYCDKFIKTGELDQEMAAKLRAYADACHKTSAAADAINAPALSGQSTERTRRGGAHSPRTWPHEEELRGIDSGGT